jgi:hypothetical protein
MRTTLKRTIGLTAGSLALVAGAIVVPGMADAQAVDPTFSATPTTVVPGDVVTFTATGCVGTLEYPQDDLSVIVANIGGGVQLSTDEAGTASGPWTVEAGFGPGSYEFTATCGADVEGDFVPLFDYETTVTLTVGAPATTSTTAAPAAATATATRPAFTG